jgi:hypothetical protein
LNGQIDPLAHIPEQESIIINDEKVNEADLLKQVGGVNQHQDAIPCNSQKKKKFKDEMASLEKDI